AHQVSVSGMEQLLLITGSGNDTIVQNVTGTNDEFRTGAGNDTINAGSGNDTLEGGAGADTLTGGSGSDLFVLTYSNQDRITDFSVTDGDKIDLSKVLTSLVGYTTGNPFDASQGFVTLDQYAGGTRILVDKDGTAGNVYLPTSVAYLVGVNPDTLSSTFNVEGFTPSIKNHQPTASNQSITIGEDSSKVFALTDFGFADIDTGNTLQSVTITTLETKGTLKLNGVDVILNQVVSAADISAGKLIYTPAANANGIAYTSFGFKVFDGTASSASAYTATINVTAVNDAPTLSTFALPVTSGSEDSQITVSFANLQSQGNEADIDGSVSAFIVKAVSTGTLKIGTSSTTATAWAAGTNDVIDATYLAYWTPTANANGALNAFTVVAKDNSGAVSTSAVQAKVSVTNVNDLSTGAVTISGTATQGQVLTASNSLSDIDGLGTVSYQWLANGTAISGATASTFTLMQAQVGKAITVKASYTDLLGSAESKTSSASSNVTNVNDAPTGTVSITGTAVQGQVLTAANSLADIDGMGTVSYQWLANGAAITGATASTFTLMQAQVGKAMTVKASYTDLLGTAESKTSSATTSVINVNDAPTASNRSLTVIEDTARVLALTDFGFADVDTGNTLQKLTITTLETKGALKLNGVDVILNQVITAADISAGKLIYTPAANANGTAYTTFGFKVSDGTATSASAYTATLNVSAVNDAPTAGNRSLTVIEDTARVLALTDFGFADVDTGNTLQKLTITTLETKGALKLNGVDVILNQVVSAADITAGKLIYTPAANANGTAYTTFGFKVSDGTATSISAYTATLNVSAVNDLPTGSVTISGTPVQGQILTAAANTLADVDGLGAISYKWLANGVAITGATASTYTLTSAQLGKTLSVTATYTDAKGTLESKTSASTLAVLNGMVTGTAGNDTLMGSYAGNALVGLAGNDLYYINHTSDLITEATNAGTDTVYSTLSTYTLASNVENGRITNTGTANLTGNTLNNTIYAGSGINSIDGGTGVDTLSYVYASTTGTTGITLDLGVLNASSQATASGISGADLIKGIENVTGSNYADILTGNSGANILTGGAGVDTLTGKLGNDTYVVALTAAGGLEDSISETSTLVTEIDTLKLTGASTNTTAVTRSLSGSLANIENLDISATGSSKLNLTGNTAANVLTGNAAANLLNGDLGNDSLSGGLGNDSLTGGTGIDHFLFNTTLGSTNIDTLTDFVHASDKLVLDDDIFTALGVVGTTTGAALNAATFYAAAGATAVHAATDRIIYNSTSGQLYYDADGLTSTAAVQIALIGVSTHTALTSTDFLIAA
ncbi:MAG: cadherin-like domain-containing protein, partial [Rhodocyclaceae bacterium]|nr:cadherin-like domain-containing protein [Rhodocyclaceae bacterium]